MQANQVPYALEAEAALIGSAIISPDCIPDILAHVEAQDFFSMPNELVFRTIIDIDEKGEIPNKITLVTYLRSRGYLERIGGIQALNAYVEVVVTPASVAYWAKLVAEKALLRRMISCGSTLERIARESEECPASAMEQAVEALMAVDTQSKYVEHLEPVKRLNLAVDRARDTDKPQVVSTPWPQLNLAIGGCYPGQLFVWAGAPKAGKSAASLCLADHIARHHGTVVYFAIEMGESEITERQLSMYSGVSVIRQRATDISQRELLDLELAAERGANLPLEVVDRKCRSIAGMRRILRRIARNGPIKSIIVDHVGKMAEVMNDTGKDNKVQRLDRAYNSLIDLGTEFSCAVHAIQHVNRKGQEAGNRPSLIDIRDGGNPEGHANAVIFVHRPDPMGLDMQAHVGEFIIAASRNGDAGVINMRFNGLKGEWTEAEALKVPDVVAKPKSSYAYTFDDR